MPVSYNAAKAKVVRLLSLAARLYLTSGCFRSG